MVVSERAVAIEEPPAVDADGHAGLHRGSSNPDDALGVVVVTPRARCIYARQHSSMEVAYIERPVEIEMPLAAEQ